MTSTAHSVYWLFVPFRYLSRCILIEFRAPSLEISMRSYAKLPDLLARSTSAVGLMISLGEEFISRGLTEMDAHILPKVRVALGGVNPRIPPNYALMIWFTMEVSIYI